MGAVIVATRYVPRPPEDQPWVRQSNPVPQVLSLVGGGFPFKPSYWKYNQDDQGLWQNKSFSTNRVIDLASVPPLVPARWKFDYHDGAVWYTKPGNIPASYMPVGGGFPFKPPYWKYNNDESAVWVGRPTPVNRVQDILPVTPIVPTRWRLDYNDYSLWSGGKSNPPSAVLIAALLANVPFKPRLWRDPQEYSVQYCAPTHVPLLLLPVGPATITVSFSLTETSDAVSFAVSFRPIWLAATKDDETWTPATKDDETWTPK